MSTLAKVGAAIALIIMLVMAVVEIEPITCTTDTCFYATRQARG